jgi:glycine/D-amino acid oxidase-like deaminating enzyme
MDDYGRYSFWLETCGDDLTPRPPLEGTVTADVAILGAGYSGLWTAYYLLQRDPSLRVVVVEAEIAGYGASGRNGGWCYAGFPVSPSVLEERYGRERTVALLRAMYDTVGEVARVCEAEGIDAQIAQSGVLRIARGPEQLSAIEGSLATYERLGVAEHYQLLSAAELAGRVRVSGALGALWVKDGLTIHPARLVRGLARAVERHGGTIYEQSPVLEFQSGASPRLITARGEVRAGAIVLAGEAYLTRFAALRRQLLPLYSLIALTEPLSAAQWAAIGWERRECLSSNRYVVDYLQRTQDGRILFGSRGAPYRYGARIADSFDHHRPTHERIKRLVREWFPSVGDIRFTHEWGGPLGVPRDWMPTVAYDRASGLATARGYSGSGVATANLTGRTLADLLTATDSPRVELPFVAHRSPDWEPEFARWLAVRLMLPSYAVIDARARRRGTPPSGRTLTERLGRH